MDFSALSDDELSATLLLLGEQAQEITDATACVRREQQRRAAAPDTDATLSTAAADALDAAIAAAPARAQEIAAQKEADAAAAVTDG